MNQLAFDLQRFDNDEKSSSGVIKLFGDLITSLGLKDFFTQGVIDFSEQKENVNPILKFIATFLGKEELNVIACSNSQRYK